MNETAEKAGHRTRAGFTTTDGHTYTSIPTTVPRVWHRWKDEEGQLHYRSGEYEIRREPYLSRFVYSVHREVDGKLTTITMLPTASLRDAQHRARRNAYGQQTFNWA